MKKYHVIGFGELLWDMLPHGKQPGGAPANFAWHCAQLGANSGIISAVGDDEPGHELLTFLENQKMSNAISINQSPTGTVEVGLKEGIPEYLIKENVAWDNIDLNASAREMLKITDALCFGSLVQRSKISRETLREAVSLTPEKSLKVFDINLRQHFYSFEVLNTSLILANVLKINDEELLVLQHMLELPNDYLMACVKIISDYDLRLLVLTRGAKDSILIADDEVSRVKTPEVKVIDTIGAGDSFTAALVVGLLNGDDLKSIHEKAVEISAFVCTQSGAMPVLPNDLK